MKMAKKQYILIKLLSQLQEGSYKEIYVRLLMLISTCIFIGDDKVKKWIFVSIVAMFFFIFSASKILAEENHIQSKGKIEGVVNFYSQDIRYLKSELNNLRMECLED